MYHISINYVRLNWVSKVSPTLVVQIRDIYIYIYMDIFLSSQDKSLSYYQCNCSVKEILLL